MEIGIVIIFCITVIGLVFFIKNAQNAKVARRNEKKLENAGLSTEGADGSEVLGLTVKGVPKIFSYKYQTPNGANVLSIVKIPPTHQSGVFQAIEYGLLNQLAATSAKFPSWKQKRNLSDYTVAFIEPHTTNQDGSPALLVAGKYQTAGTVIGVGGGDFYPAQTIILPHQAETSWGNLEYLMYSVWNESEHDAEFANDLSEAMKYTGAGDVHQHHNLPPDVKMLTPAATARGFAAPTRPSVKCNFNPFPVTEDQILTAIETDNGAKNFLS